MPPQRPMRKSVRVGSECGITVRISDDNEYLRVSFWHERVAPDDSLETLKRTTELINEYNEEMVNKLATKYARLAATVRERESAPAAVRRRRRPS